VYIPHPSLFFGRFNSFETHPIHFPLYDFAKLPDGLWRGQPSLARDDVGNLYGISIPYETQASSKSAVTAISLWIQPDFARPYPLWSSEPVEADEPAVILEKVRYLPVPGIKVSTREGFVCYWIESDTLYTLVADPSPTGQDAQALLESLSPV
jgi:hypothetical protein